MATILTLGPRGEKFVNDQISSGHYSSANDVVGDALRHFEDVQHLRPMSHDEMKLAVETSRKSELGRPIQDVFADILFMLATGADDMKPRSRPKDAA
jgi:putative addiction module CopG family antidote